MAFPGTPLVLRWTSVPRAYKYRVYIATDPGLGTLAVSDRGGPITTSGTVYSPAVNLRARTLLLGRRAGRRELAPRRAIGRGLVRLELAERDQHRGERPDRRAGRDGSAPGVESGAGSGRLRGRGELLRRLVRRLEGLLQRGDPRDRALARQDPSEQRLQLARAGARPGRQRRPVERWARRSTSTSATSRRRSGPPAARPQRRAPDRGDDEHEQPGRDLGSGARRRRLRGPGRTVQRSACASGRRPARHVWRDAITAATAWTPLAPGHATRPTRTTSDVGIATTRPHRSSTARPYCFRVRARTGNAAVVQRLDAVGRPRRRRLHVRRAADPGRSARHDVRASTGSRCPAASTPRTPLFTWQPIRGELLLGRRREGRGVHGDLRRRVHPRHGLRAARRQAPETYPDDTTPYYWAVLPASEAGGGGVGTVPAQQLPHSFVKSSDAPALLSPAQGTDLSGQPVFRWALARGRAGLPAPGRAGPDVRRTDRRRQDAGHLVHADRVLPGRHRALLARARDRRQGSRADVVADRARSAGACRSRRSPRTTRSAARPSPRSPGTRSTAPSLLLVPRRPVRWHQARLHAARHRLHSHIFYGTGVWRWQVRANFPGGNAQFQRLVERRRRSRGRSRRRTASTRSTRTAGC